MCNLWDPLLDYSITLSMCVKALLGLILRRMPANEHIIYIRPIFISFFSVYNTCSFLLNDKKYNVDANLDASHKVIYQRCLGLQAKVKNWNETKQVMAKGKDM